MTLHHYRAFGLVFRSPDPIVSLAPSEVPATTPHDVEIVYGPVDDPVDPVEVDEMLLDYRPAENALILQIPEAGKFKVIDGHRIVVEPETGASPDEIHLYLLGSAFGTLLHQRQILPMHGNAVEVNGTAFLFCGDSGAGKSTLAAYLQDRGYNLLTDDVCALKFDDDGRLVAWSGIARLKLWGEAMSQFGRPTDGLRRVAWTDDKFELPIHALAANGPYPVGGIYHLREADEERSAGIFRLRGIEAANTVTANIYRRRVADLIGASRFYIETSVNIIKSIPIFTMNRNWGLERFEMEAQAAEIHMRESLDYASR